MKSLRIVLLTTALAVTVGVVAGCRAKKKEITELQRKEAAHLASEAQFAITMRNWAEAEAGLTKAVAACPDVGAYWVSLGSIRVKLGKKDAAKDAYKGALAAYEIEAEKDKTDPGPWLQQVYVLALMGRQNDARALLDKAAKRFPEHRAVKRFIETKEFDRMLTDQKFKDNAL
jgi:tetratricopeptide (TPR) repeat protein